MNAYLESSVILRIILGQPDKFADWNRLDKRICSCLVELECLRAIDRMRLGGLFSEEEMVARREVVFQLLQTSEMIDITRPILARAAEAFPVVIGTLDAIHLATALAWQDDQSKDLIMATHDKALAQAARAMGMQTIGI